jgi:hypothetical protein
MGDYQGQYACMRNRDMRKRGMRNRTVLRERPS